MNKYLAISGTLLILLFIVHCEKTGPRIPANHTPDTRILSHVIHPLTEADSGLHRVTVYWTGSDVDGFVKGFEYSTNNSEFNFTTASQNEFRFDLSLASNVYPVYVRAIDDKDRIDNTPASVSIQYNSGLVETILISGPPNGMQVSTAVSYGIEGYTETGIISAIRYQVDDETPVEISTLQNNTSYIDIFDLNTGAHTISFTAVRDDGVSDPTPLFVTIVSEEACVFVPEISYTTRPDNYRNQDFSWEVANYYYSPPIDNISFELVTGSTNPPQNFMYNDLPLASGWTAADSFSVPVESLGATNIFYLKSRDAAGCTDLQAATFHYEPWDPTSGILVLDDFYPDIYWEEFYLANTFFRDFSYNTISIADPLTPDLLASASSTVLYTDYDFVSSVNGPLLAAYANAGGNLMISGSNLDVFATDFSPLGIEFEGSRPVQKGFGSIRGVPGTDYENWNLGRYITGYGITINDSLIQVFRSGDSSVQPIFYILDDNDDSLFCGMRKEMPNGNVLIFLGQSIAVLAEVGRNLGSVGRYILETEFGEKPD